MTDQGTGRPGPNRFTKAFLRLPVMLYQLGLGPRLADRGIFVLHTKGRKSGLRRCSGLNYAADGSAIYAIAGWGPRTGWYQDLLADPSVEVQVGGKRFVARARPVTDEEEQTKAATLLACVDGGPPRLLRPLLARLGFDYDAERRDAFANPSALTIVALELGTPLPPGNERPLIRRMALPVTLAVLGAATVLRRRRRR